mmetsp:Transcript_70566/g.204510  ORF Transcript_70566/g.204510 Transcript_70566/m.204510 type:complete len:207 (+) Transcript_70566:246-866(+)
MLQILPCRRSYGAAPRSLQFEDGFGRFGCSDGSPLGPGWPATNTILNYQASNSMDVLGTEDIIVGAGIALLLAFTTSFLQGRRAQNDFVLWEKPASDDIDSALPNGNTTESRIFDGDAWKEIARPDNYVYYNRQVFGDERKNENTESTGVEKKWVFIALLALFVPIFSIEFFFALSRQVICDLSDPISRSDLSEFLCSPVEPGAWR